MEFEADGSAHVKLLELRMLNRYVVFLVEDV